MSAIAISQRVLGGWNTRENSPREGEQREHVDGRGGEESGQRGFQENGE